MLWQVTSPARSEHLGFMVPHEPEQASFMQAPGSQPCVWGTLCSAGQRNSPKGGPRLILEIILLLSEVVSSSSPEAFKQYLRNFFGDFSSMRGLD